VAAIKGKLYAPKGAHNAVAGTALDQPSGTSIVDRGPTVDALLPALHILGSITNQLTASTDTGAQMLAKVQTYVNARFANNANLKFMIICKIPPRVDNTFVTLPNYAAREQARVDYNAALDVYAASEPRIRIVTYTGFDATIGADKTIDGLHQQWKQADDVMGANIAAAVNALTVAGTITTGAVNRLANPAMTGTPVAATGTGVSGVIPPNWNVAIGGTGLSAVFSVVDMVDQDGVAVKGTQMVVSGTADANLRAVQISQTINTTAYASAAQGIESWFDYEMDAGSANVCTIFGTVKNVGQTPNVGVTAGIDAGAKLGRLRAIPYVLAAPDSAVGIVLGLKVNTAGPVNATVRFCSPVAQVVQQANP
jgi:hypothetical protein